MDVADFGDDVFDPAWEEGVGVCVERSHGAAELYAVGDDVGGASAGDLSDGDDGGVERVDGAADGLLKLADDLGGDPDSVYGFVRASAVTGFAGDDDF